MLELGLALLVSAVQERGALRAEDDPALAEGRLRLGLSGQRRRQPDGSRLARAPRGFADVGLSDLAELGIEYELRHLARSRAFRDRGWQSGDAVWRLRLTPMRRGPWEAGALFAWKIPTSLDERGTGTDEGDALASLFAVHRHGRFSCGGEARLALLGDNRQDEALDAFGVGSIHAGVALSEGVRLRAEWWGSLGPRGNRHIGRGMVGDGWSMARGALSVGRGAWEFGVAAEAGLNRRSPGLGVFAYVASVHALPDGLVPEADAPEPIELLAPFESRPAETYPLGAGSAGVAGGARRQADGSLVGFVPRGGLSFGLGPAADARWESDYRLLRGSRAFREGGAPGEVRMEARWVPARGEAWRLGALLGGRVGLSRSRRGVSTGLVDAYAKALVTWRRQVVAIHANVGAAFEGNPRRRARQVDSFLFGLIAEWRIRPAARLSAGVEGSLGGFPLRHLAAGWAGRGRVLARAALEGALPGSERTFWSLVGGAALTRNAPRWEAAAGVTVFWGGGS